MNTLVSDTSFVFNDNLYALGDKVAITKCKNEVHIGKTGIVKKVFTHKNFPHQPHFTLLLDHAGNNQENQHDSYTVALHVTNFDIKPLSKTFEVELI